MKEKNILLPLFLTFFLIALNGCEYPLLLLLAAVIHEAAHIGAAAALGARISLRRFLPSGLLLEYDCHLIHPMKEAVIAGAGIVANITAAVLCRLFADKGDAAAFFFFSANAVLAIINMLPISGLDGATICELAISQATDPITASRIASRISDIGAVSFTLFSIYFNLRIGLNLSLLVMSLYLDIMLLSGKKISGIA